MTEGRSGGLCGSQTLEELQLQVSNLPFFFVASVNQLWVSSKLSYLETGCHAKVEAKAARLNVASDFCQTSSL